MAKQQPAPSDKKAKKTTRRPALPKISEEMKAWSAALAAEIGSWPKVFTKPMFGFTAYYRGDHIFAVLPHTRTMEVANSIVFKLASPSSKLLDQLKRDPRIYKSDFSKGTWFNFELTSDQDLQGALKWLLLAHEECRVPRRR